MQFALTLLFMSFAFATPTPKDTKDPAQASDSERAWLLEMPADILSKFLDDLVMSDAIHLSRTRSDSRESVYNALPVLNPSNSHRSTLQSTLGTKFNPLMRHWYGRTTASEEFQFDQEAVKAIFEFSCRYPSRRRIYLGTAPPPILHSILDAVDTLAPRCMSPFEVSITITPDTTPAHMSIYTRLVKYAAVRGFFFYKFGVYPDGSEMAVAVREMMMAGHVHQIECVGKSMVDTEMFLGASTDVIRLEGRLRPVTNNLTISARVIKLAQVKWEHGAAQSVYNVLERHQKQFTKVTLEGMTFDRETYFTARVPDLVLDNLSCQSDRLPSAAHSLTLRYESAHSMSDAIVSVVMMKSRSVKRLVLEVEADSRISKKLPLMSNVEEATIKIHSYSRQDVGELIMAVGQMRTLKYLKLALPFGELASDDFLRLLKWMISKLKLLTRLSLQVYELGDDGVSVLSDMIRSRKLLHAQISSDDDQHPTPFFIALS
jgi:hypothetical protein